MVLKNLILISPSSPNIFLKLGLPKNSFCKVAFDNCVGALKLAVSISASSKGLTLLISIGFSACARALALLDQFLLIFF